MANSDGSEFYQGEEFIVAIDEDDLWLPPDVDAALKEFIESIDEDQQLHVTLNDDRLTVKKLRKVSR